MSSSRVLLEKIQALPPERLREVEDFVDSLNVRYNREQALERFIDAARQIHDAEIAALSMEEIDAEVKAVRAERKIPITTASGAAARG